MMHIASFRKQRLTHLSDIAALADEEEVEVAEVVVDAGTGEVVAGGDVDPEWSDNTLRCINIKVSTSTYFAFKEKKGGCLICFDFVIDLSRISPGPEPG